jgi:hypothetical protein
VRFTKKISEERFGLVTAFRLPGGSEVALYEPRHPSPLSPGNVSLTSSRVRRRWTSPSG